MTNSQARLIGLAIMALAGAVAKQGSDAEVGGIVFLVSGLAFGIQLWMSLRPAEKPSQGPPKCRKCGYDLTGNVSGVCPECGEHVGSGPAS